MTATVDATEPRVAIAASPNQVILALGSSLFRLDPATREVRESFTSDMDVKSVRVSPVRSAVSDPEVPVHL